MLKAERWQLQQGCKCCARMNQANQQLHQEICELHMPKPYSLRLRLPACRVTNLAQNLPTAPSPCHGRRPCSEDAGEPSVPKASADDFSTMRKGWLDSTLISMWRSFGPMRLRRRHRPQATAIVKCVEPTQTEYFSYVAIDYVPCAAGAGSPDAHSRLRNQRKVPYPCCK